MNGCISEISNMPGEILSKSERNCVTLYLSGSSSTSPTCHASGFFVINRSTFVSVRIYFNSIFSEFSFQKLDLMFYILIIHLKNLRLKINSVKLLMCY